MQEPRAVTIGYARVSIAKIRAALLTRNEKARRIRTILRTIHWGRK